jgi:D-alanyl-D-alanine carboxypeptidase
MKYIRIKIGSKNGISIVVFILIIIISILFVKIKFNDKSNNIISVISKEETNDEENSITENSSFPDNVFGVPVYTELIDIGTKARDGTKRKIKYIVIHETDNYEIGVGAENHAIYLENNNSSSTSWHYTVDDTEIYHHIPDNEIANHAGDEIGNEYGIGIELCVNEDGDFEKTFENAAKLVAYLLNEYNLTIDDVKTHNDFSGKDCPHLILQNNRMQEFKSKVEYYYDNRESLSAEKTTSQKNNDIEDWKLTLVNYENELPDNYEIELSDIDSTRKFDSRAIGELNKMIAKMKKDGITNIWVQSSYRTVAKQKELFDEKVETYMKQGKTKSQAEELTLQTINKPGTSEHNLGLAVDFNYVNYDFEDTKAFTWLQNNAENYGFILRYKEEKEDITKVNYEPWHWRYVGVENAKKMNELNMCLEEYIDYLKGN